MIMAVKFFSAIIWIDGRCDGCRAAVAGLMTGARGNELFSESVSVPKVISPVANETVGDISGWNNFNVLMWGTEPLPAQSPADTNTDPFAVNGASTINTNGTFTPLAPIGTGLPGTGADTGAFVGPGPISVKELQRVTFAGSTPINQANIPNQGLDNPVNQVQFGLSGPADNSVMNFLGQHWGGQYTFMTPGTHVSGGQFNYLRAVPIVNVVPHPAPPAAPPTGESFEYIVDFSQFTQGSISVAEGGAGGAGGKGGGPNADGTTITGSEWVEFPFVPGQQPTFTYNGWGDTVDPIHFTVNFVQISPTMIPLDDLNYADDPPPIVDPLSGASTFPAFSVQDNPDDIVAAVPEPGIVGMIAMGLSGWKLRRRNKTQRS